MPFARPADWYCGVYVGVVLDRVPPALVGPGQLHLPPQLLPKARGRQHAQHPLQEHPQHSDRQNQGVVSTNRRRNIANKSSLSYIACYARAGTNYVYLQRGYRNYGIPQVTPT